MVKTIAEMGETKNLNIMNATLAECAQLQRIAESWVEKRELEGENVPTNYIHKCLTNADLPPIPDARQEYFRLKSITLKDSGKQLGFIELYFGYPTKETIWIANLVLAKEYQKNGYGQEVIEYISKEASKAEFKKVGIGVYLKNWSALRFWTKSGFDQISGIYGDKVYSENTFALIGLEKNLS